MLINGFQKLTLLDFPGQTACTVFTGGCNLRCPFCHNALLVTEVNDLETYDEEEIFSFLKKRQRVLDGVAITGGEPLIQKDIDVFIRKIRDLNYKVKLDTNGFFPEKLKALVSDGLIDYVAVDIKNCKEKYAKTCGRPDLDISPVEETVDFLLKGTVPYEFRTTVVSEYHDIEDMEEIGKWIKGAENYFLQKFVDSGNLIDENCHEATKQEMLKMKEIAGKYVQNCELRGVD